jgi:MFS family permease
MSKQHQEQQEHEECRRAEDPKLSHAGLALVILTPALCSFVYGVDLGVTSFVLQMLRDPNSSDSDVWWQDMAGNNIQQGLFVSGLSLGALLGSHVVLFYLARIIGRRAELRIAACLYLLGTLFNLMSGTVLKNSSTFGFATLLVGRLLFGAGVGLVQHAAPIYMSEMCPARIRGSVVTAKEASIVIGIVCGYAAGDMFSSRSSPLQWAGTCYAVT